jgi:hypothetical protein
MKKKGEKEPSTKDRDETVKKIGSVNIITEAGAFQYHQTLQFVEVRFFEMTHHIGYDLIGDKFH